ncbi:MAG: response regulator transcription factor [Pseudomonadota bacterium]
MTQMNKRILLVEDHRDIAELLYEHLERCGYILDYAADGVTGLHLAVTNRYDAIILDLMLPGMDGTDVCARLRKDAKDPTPILMLTARDTLQDKIAGLDIGADDYVVKPFELQELEARLRAVMRRTQGGLDNDVLKVGDLTLDTGTLEVHRAGAEISLMPIGLKMLTVLMRASPRVVTREDLERQVWGDVMPDSDALRSHLYNLRKAVDRPFDSQLVHTVHGAGYRVASLEGDA